MFRILFSFLILAVFFPCAASLASETQPLTLRQAYELALKQSETLAIQKETLNEAQAHFYQALNAVMPSVSFKMTRFEQDAPEASSSSSGVSNAFREVTPEKKFTFSQPLFSGFKEFAGIAGAGAEKAQRQFELRRAKEILFLNVMESFYALAEARKDLEILSRMAEAMKKRLKELSKRVRIGRSRDSEFRTTLSDLKIIEADLEAAWRLEKVTKNLLEFYIGRKVLGGLIEDGEESKISNVLSYKPKALKRSDVRASEEAYKLAQKKVVVAQAGFFPTIKVDGNYYAQRVGFQSGNDWDALLTLEVPVFKGTDTVGQVKEAAADRETARLAWELKKREAERDIQDAVETLQSSLKEEKALAEAVSASKVSYELLSRDYRQNLASNLEVLEGLKRHQETSRRLNTASKAAKKNYWKLKIALGENL